MHDRIARNVVGNRVDMDGHSDAGLSELCALKRGLSRHERTTYPSFEAPI